jgi:acetyl-CoA acetyltransferase
MTNRPKGLLSQYDDVWLVDGVRTAFADYNTVLGLISPIDLGIKVAREVFRRTGISPAETDTVIAGSMAQASFDAYMLPRHISIYSGVPIEVPSHLVQRVCGTGMEVILQAADLIKLGKVDLALGVGTESMSPIPSPPTLTVAVIAWVKWSSRIFSGKPCSTPAAMRPWAGPRKPWPSDTIFREKKSTASPPIVSRAPWQRRRVVF